VVITALKSDHFTVNGNVPEHTAERAIDIGTVDGETCRGIRTGGCARWRTSSPRSPGRCARRS
jgi:hypothetical protein